MICGVTDEQLKAGINIMLAACEILMECKTYPSGHFYARLCNCMSLAEYHSMVRFLEENNLVIERDHILVWIGPSA